MGRFASTVPYYAACRSPYGPGFFTAVAERLHLNGTQRLLDLGTGPGLLALGLKAFVREAVGVDPEPAMIEAAREAAKESGVTIQFVEGRAEDIASDLGAFDLVTIGRALHWMEPAAIRSALTRVMPPGCHLLLCRAGSADDGRNPWLPAYEAVRKAWARDSGPRLSRAEQADILSSLALERQEPVAVESETEVSIDALVGRVLSMSSSAPSLIGDGVATLAEAMHEALRPFTSDGCVREVVMSRADVFQRGMK